MKKYEVYSGLHVIVTVSHIGYILNDDYSVTYRAKATVLKKTGVDENGKPCRFAEKPGDRKHYDDYDFEMINASDSCDVIKQINALTAQMHLVELDIQNAHKNGIQGMYAVEGLCARLAD